LAFGTCPNVDRCTKGATGALIDLYPGLGEICPECGKRLTPQGASINATAPAGVPSSVGSFISTPGSLAPEFPLTVKPKFIRSDEHVAPAPEPSLEPPPVPQSTIAAGAPPPGAPAAEPPPVVSKIPPIKPIPPPEEPAVAEAEPVAEQAQPRAEAPTAMEIAARNLQLQAALPRIKPIKPSVAAETPMYDFRSTPSSESRTVTILKKVGFWGSGVGVGIACAVVFTSVLPHAMAPASSGFHICASSGVAERLAPDLIKAFVAKTGPAHISVITSSPAQTAQGLAAGRDCQLGLGEGTPPSSKQATLVDSVVGLDGVVVIVNAANPVRALTMKQVAAIFSGRIISWASVGGPSEPITVIAPSEGSDQLAILHNAILRGAPLTLSSRRADSPTAAATFVGADRNAIGLASFAASDPGVVIRLLGTGHDDVAASTLTIGEKRYPLTVPVYVSRRSDLSDPAIDSFIAFVHSQRGQMIVGGDGFVSSTSL